MSNARAVLGSVRRRRLIAGLAAAACAVLSAPALPAPAAAASAPSPTGVVVASTAVPGVLSLSFRSAALGRETTSLVYLPDTYRENGRRSAAAYLLHDALSPLTSASAAADQLGLPGTARSRTFVVV